MYLTHFGLECPPFKITPNPDFFYSGANRGAILDALVYAITNGEGIVKVVGEVGSGKTMLCRMLETRLPKNVEMIYLANPSLSREEIFHAIASDLNLDITDKCAGEVLRAMQNYLIQMHVDGKQIVILIEEAQAMPLETLEEIRLLSNLETSHNKLLQIVLFGQPELDDNLNLPQMRQLKERIIHSFWVPPMTSKDIPEYLMFRMRAAGYRGPDIFTPGAVKLLIKASGGITRRINILADKALLAVFAENQYIVQRKHAQAAIADSEFAVGNKFSLPPKAVVFAVLFLVVGIGLGMVVWNQLSKGVPPPSTGRAVQAEPRPVAPPPSAPPPQASDLAPRHEAVATPAPAATHFLEQRLNASGPWLKKTDPNRFTIQLMLTGTDKQAEEQLENFLGQAAKEIGIERFYVFRGKTPQGLRIGVLYDSFANTGEAYASLSALPEKYRINGALLRTLKGVQAEGSR
ncbi:MAG: AAA family ATPase [Sulfuricella sp.]|nr:AAA family ATPase [Sulfuricella sp.]